ncbi:dimethylarginine dimethylaminohydrolase family protein [Viridibacillus arvi]|uniref:dimethylarginine dimethylaminohydrolase family protein n=1 Tax=Viridibacillus arvi TaxID=263475 RepID=UPI003D01408E
MFCDSMYAPLKRVIVKSPEAAFINQQHLEENWEKYFYLSEPNLKEAINEYESFLDILKKYVETIDFLPQNESVGLDSLYAHDPVKFTPHGAIILRSGKELRQPEADVFKEFLAEKDIPIIGSLKGEAISDGGDIVWLNERTVAIGRGYRTNDEAIRQLTEIFKPFVDEVMIVPLPHDLGEESCLHLMSFISIVDKDLAVVHSRLMPVFLRQWLLEKGFTLLEVPNDEYDTLACNVLAIAPRVCVLPEGNPITEQLLKEAGATVYTYKGDEITVKGTGGPTCLTCPVERY